jgi:hypothetical protein
MNKFYSIVAGEYTYYATDIKCTDGYIHIYGGLMTRGANKEFRNLSTVDFNEVTCISTYGRDGFNLVLSTFDYTLDDNDNIVSKDQIETFVSFKSLDDIVWESKDKDDIPAYRLYGKLYGLQLSQYEKLRQMFGERKKIECKFNESETFLVFEHYHIAVELLNFEERTII